MRTFITSCVAAAALVTALAPAAHAQTDAANAPRRAPVFYAYHGVTGLKQLEHFNTLRSRGYRPITVTVADAASPRYGAVWVKTPGAAWAMYQGLSSNNYQQRFDERLAAGYRPISVSASGSGDSAVFAAIFEKAPGRFFAKHNINADQFADANADAARRGYVLTAMNVYGTAEDPRYVAVWTQRPGTWAVTTGLNPQAHHQEFVTRTENGEKPSLVSVGPGNTYTAVWVKATNDPWHEYTNMSSSEYQRRFDRLKGRGFFPVQLDTEEGRYAAVWTRG